MFFDEKISDVTIFNKSNISELESILLKDGELQIVSYAELENIYTKSN